MKENCGCFSSLVRYSTVAIFLLFSTAANCDFDTILKKAEKIEDWLVKIRRDLHRIPEVRYEEYRTSEYLKNMIDEILQQKNVPYAEVSTRWGASPHLSTQKFPTGIVVDIGTGRPPCVALRADIDALPIHETNDVEYRSEREGFMHACGHDAHMAILLGALKLVSQMEESSIKGTIRFIFQPAEEGGLGAQQMCKENVLTKYPPVISVFGLHVDPTLQTGEFGGRAGVFYSAGISFEAVVEGMGGHAAYPHMGTDPVLAAAKVINDIYVLFPRSFIGLSDFRTAVITVSAIKGGEAFNVVPPKVQLLGTVRSLSLEGLAEAQKQIDRICQLSANTSGCSCTVSFGSDSPLFPPVLNNPSLWHLSKQVLGGRVREKSPTFGGEDFGFYGQMQPSLFLSLGINREKGLEIPGLHRNNFELDERSLPFGVAAHVCFALVCLLSGGSVKNNDDRIMMIDLSSKDEL